jgi:hypothetical protein
MELKVGLEKATVELRMDFDPFFHAHFEKVFASGEDDLSEDIYVMNAAGSDVSMLLLGDELLPVSWRG